MRAAMFLEPGRFELHEVARPDPGPGEALIRIARTGICGTDMHILQGADASESLPMVPGHEFTGHVAALGPVAEEFKEGQPGVGDVNVMPAGASHDMVDCSEDILMVGGCPDGRGGDNIQDGFLTDEPFRRAARRIMMMPIPPMCPVTGEAQQQWLDAPSSVDGGWNDFRDGLDASS